MLSPKQVESIGGSTARLNIWEGSIRSGKGGRCPDRTAPAYNSGVETKVLTPKGFRLIGDIQVGAQVCNPDGTVARVIGVFDNGPKQFYRVTLADGSSVEADGDHLWAISLAGARKRRKIGPPVIPDGLRPEDEWNLRVQSRCRIVNTVEMMRLVQRADDRKGDGWKVPCNVLIPLTNPVSMNGGTSRWETFSPYTLGVLLGDGHLAEVAVSFTSADPEVAERVAGELPENLHIGRTDQSNTGLATNHHITRKRYNKPLEEGGFVEALIAARTSARLTQKELGAKADLLQSHVSQIERRTCPASVAAAARLDAALGQGGELVELHSGECAGDSAMTLLKREGLHFLRSWEKFVPDRVKVLPAADRFAFVQGLMDTDGTIDKTGHAGFTSVSERLTMGLRDVLHSLGYRATVSTRTTSYTHNGEKRTGRLAYSLYIQGRNVDRLFSVPRKRDRARSYLAARHNVEPFHRVVSVEPTEIDNSRCIQVDNLNHLYVTDDYIVTHNTIASLWRWLMFVANAPLDGELVMFGKTRDSVASNLFQPLSNPDIFGELTRDVQYTSGAPTAKIFGRTIRVIGANDAKAEPKVRGGTWTGAYGDELTTLPDTFFRQALGRLSTPSAQLFGTTNPDNPAHWLRKDFLLDDRLDLRSWHFTLDDNPHLDPGYVANIKAEYKGLWYKRFVEGLWIAAEGAVFDMWDEDLHVLRGPVPQLMALPGVGVDYGTTAAFSAHMLGVAAPDHVKNTPIRLVLTREYRHDPRIAQRQKTDAEFSADLRAWIGSDRPQWVCVDPSAASFKVQLWRDHIDAMDAKNDVLDTIRLASSLLATGKLVVHESCKGLIQEVPGYAWDPAAALRGEDKPIKVDDHGIDSGLRYAVSSTETLWRTYFPKASYDVNHRHE